MGCNCGDNEYNIEIENNGSCEPTTPIYNITLANVGVDGFSPLVEFVDVTSASFRIQTTDKNGINVSEPIPLSDYIEDNFAKLASANTFTANNTFNGLTYFNGTMYTDKVYSKTPTTPLIIGGNSSTITLGANTTTVNYHGFEIATLNDIPEVPDVSNFLNKDGSNAASTINLQNISLTGKIQTVQPNFYISNNKTSSGNITVDTYDGDIYLSPDSSHKLYYRNKEIATVDQIPDTSNFVTIDTAQTITGSKTFSNNISIQANSGGAGSILGVGENYAVGLLGFTTSGAIQVGSSASNLYLNGALDRPSYNGTDLALLSDIPSLTGYATEQWVGQQGYLTNSDLADYVTNSTLTTTLANYQPLLVSGTNIKTINNQSLLGSGNIDIQGGGSTISNPLEIEGDVAGIRIGVNNSTNQPYIATYNKNYPRVSFPAYLLGVVSNPLSISDYQLGLKALSLNYDTDILKLDSNNKLTVKEMVGCDSITGGASGLVPAPSAGDQDKFLKGDGTWDTVGGGGSSYTAGTGIDITNEEISVDSTVERTTNKVTALSADLTNTQYPSAKLFYDTVTALTQVIFQLDSRITALENNINGGNA